MMLRAVTTRAQNIYLKPHNISTLRPKFVRPYGHFRPAAEIALSARTESMSQVCILLVTGKLKPGTIDAFVKHFAVMAKHVKANEEGCLTYQLTISEEDPNAFIIFERYITKQYLEEVHFKSEQLVQFRAACKEEGVEWEEKSMIKYLDATSVGFLSKA